MLISILHVLLVIVEVFCSILLVGVILLQRTRGQGMGIMLGGGAVESVFGAQMGNVLTKATVILGIVFLVNTVLLSVIGGGRGGEARSVAEQIAPEPAPAPTPNAPGGSSPMDMPAGDMTPREPITVPADGAAPMAAPAEPAPVADPAPAESPAPAP